jgi:hypothetical protein
VSALRKVTVAILSWNGRRHLETCLDALAIQQDPEVDWEVLVLDNGSTDGTAAWMRERWGRDRRVRLIESPVNLGFCGGNNRLAAEAPCSTTTPAPSPAGWAPWSRPSPRPRPTSPSSPARSWTGTASASTSAAA